MQTALFTIALGLTVYVREDPTPDGWVIVFYLFASVIPIGGNIAMMRATQVSGAGRVERAYDRPTIQVSKWTLLSSAGFVLLVALSCYYGRLPFQGSVQLPIADVLPYKWQFDGSAGIIVQAEIHPGFWDKNGLPPALNLEVEIGRQLNANWKIIKVKGFTDQERKCEATEGPATDPSTNTRTRWTGTMVDLLPNGSYFIDIYLHRETDGIERDRAMGMIRNDRDVLTITMSLP